MPARSQLGRLRERKLVEWTFAYLAGAWLVFEVSDAVGGHLGWPDSLYIVLLVLLAFGFFATLILAWYHGEKGRQRASGPELLMIAILLGIAGIALTSIGGQAPATIDAKGATEPPDLDGGRPAIAVLPFENLSSEPHNTFFAAGIHEEIIGQLAKISGLAVISRTSVMGYAEETKSTREIAAELGVDFILEGSARRDLDHVRVTVQLIEGATDRHVWVENYDRELTVGSLFEIQDDVAGRVAVSLTAAILRGDAASMRESRTTELSAYDAYLLGRHHARDRVEDGLQRAIGYYREAVRIDPKFAAAYAALAGTYALLPMYSSAPPAEWFPLARAAVDTALALDSTLVEVQTAAAYVAWRVKRDWREAELRYRKVLRLSQSASDGHLYLACILVQRERGQEALAHVEQLVRLDPRSFVAMNVAAAVNHVLKRFPETLAYARRARELSPDNIDPPRLIALSLYALGRFEEARAELHDQLGGGDWMEHLPNDLTAARAGWRAHRAAHPDLKVDVYWQVQVAALLQDRDVTMQLLQQLHAAGSPWISWAVQYPIMDFLHDEPAFMRIATEAGVVLDRRRRR
jgi:TolB-like protein